MTNTTSKPENVIRISNISAAIWKRPGKEGNGAFYSVQLQRSYRTVDGTQYTGSFNHEDLLNVAAVATRAEQWSGFSGESCSKAALYFCFWSIYKLWILAFEE